MPYLASNEDAREGSHGKALAIAGGVFAVAAVAGAMGNAKAIKSFVTKNTDQDVVKALYGGAGKDLNAVAKSYAQAVNPDLSAGHMYDVGKTLSGAPKLYKTKVKAKQVLDETGKVVDTKYRRNGTMIGDAVRNFMDKDLRETNRTIKALYKGRGDDVYKKSKLALYDSLNSATESMNVTTSNLTETTKRIYDSKANSAWRKANLDGNASDVDITNAIWGKRKKRPVTYHQKSYNVKNNPLDMRAPMVSPNKDSVIGAAKDIKPSFVDPFERMPMNNVNRNNVRTGGVTQFTPKEPTSLTLKAGSRAGGRSPSGERYITQRSTLE